MSEIKIRRELDLIKTSILLSNIGSSAGPQKKTDLFKWNVLLKGPKKSCYEKGLFKLLLIFPNDYPESPPDIKFVTKIFHPNISPDDGAICISSKANDWNKESNIINIIYSISIKSKYIMMITILRTHIGWIINRIIITIMI